MSRLTYWNDKSKGSALPMPIPDSMCEVVSLEDICAKLAAYEDAEEHMADDSRMKEIMAICGAATPGPWMWEIRTGHKMCRLMTAHSGQYYVMDFARWGMHDACPVFQRYEKYAGPVDERNGLGMTRADKMAKSYPGKEHHQGYDDYINHPDAIFIAKAPEIVSHLLAEIKQLRAKLEADPATRDRCCMCPGAVCPGIPGTPHPEPSPCRLTGGDVTWER